MHTDESASIAAAVAAELTCFGGTLRDRLGFMAGYVDGGGASHPAAAAIARCELPTSTVIEHLGDRIGLLDATLAYEVVQCWHNIKLVANLLAVTGEEVRAGVFNKAFARQREGYARDLEVRCAELAQRLSGIVTGPAKAPEEVSLDALRAHLAQQPGDLADAREREQLSP